jgi:hypothetical protein
MVCTDFRFTKVAPVKMHRYLSTGFLLLASCVITMASGTTWAAATTVYKCFDKNLGVLYTDVPCKGEQMSIRAGEADPVAVAELQRERDALSRSAAQRIADSCCAALDRITQWRNAPMVLRKSCPRIPTPMGITRGLRFAPYPSAHRDRPPMRDARRPERERFIAIPPRGNCEVGPPKTPRRPPQRGHRLGHPGGGRPRKRSVLPQKGAL